MNNGETETETNTGDGGNLPEVGDIISFDLKGYVLGSDEEITDILSPAIVSSMTQSPTQQQQPSHFLNVKDWTIKLGDADLPPALEMTLRFLSMDPRGGVVRSRSKYMYGLTGRRRPAGTNKEQRSTSNDDESDESSFIVPPYSTIECSVVIKTIKPAISLTLEDAILCAKSKKIIGNDSFLHGDYEKCLRLYNSAVDLLVGQNVPEIEADACAEGESNDNRQNAQFRKSRIPIVVDCLNNIAMVQYKRKEFGSVKDACSKILDKWDDRNQKALCRIVQASVELADFEGARSVLSKAIKFHPDSKDVKRIAMLYKQKKLDYKQQQKDLYEKMLGNDNVGNSSKAIVSSRWLSIDSETKQKMKMFAISIFIGVCGVLLKFLLTAYYKEH